MFECGIGRDAIYTVDLDDCAAFHRTPLTATTDGEYRSVNAVFYSFLAVRAIQITPNRYEICNNKGECFDEIRFHPYLGSTKLINACKNQILSYLW